MRLAAAALLLAAAPLLAAAEDEIGVGLPAPSFSLKTLNPEVAGTTWLPLDRYVGENAEDPDARVVLLSFFASWCGPCRRELPFLAQLDVMYRPQGLRVVGISIDRDEAGMEAARRLLAASKVGYPVLSDRFNFLAKRYLGDAAPLPSVFLVARDGTVTRIERGYAKDASAFLLAEVQAALGLRAAPAARPASLVRPAAAAP
jgi:thiol-disulfide isomerase/thioredoxin